MLFIILIVLLFVFFIFSRVLLNHTRKKKRKNNPVNQFMEINRGKAKYTDVCFPVVAAASFLRLLQREEGGRSLRVMVSNSIILH